MARKTNNIWNVWKGENHFNYARSGYYTDEFAKNNQVVKYDSNQYPIVYDDGKYYEPPWNYTYYDGNDYYEPPGYGGLFGDQFQQRQFRVWENRGPDQSSGVQRKVVSYSLHCNNQGVSSYAFSYQHGAYPQSYPNSQNSLAATHPQNYNSQNYNGNYPIAKRSRWDNPKNENRVVLYSAQNERRIRCYDCGRLFPSYNTLYKHKGDQHKRSFYCSVCNKECPSHALLKKHETSHTVNACQKCPETFKYKESLVAHVKHAHHVKLPTVAEDNGTEAADQGISPQPNSSVPEHAKENIDKNDKSSFSEPAAASTPIAEKKNQTEASGNSDSGVKTEQFPCPYCIKSFESEKKMHYHCKIHTEADPDADGSSQADDKSQNNSAAILACPLCIKKFTSRRDLFVHMMSAHTQAFYCLKCPAEFPSQNELTSHQRVHN